MLALGRSFPSLSLGCHETAVLHRELTRTGDYAYRPGASEARLDIICSQASEVSVFVRDPLHRYSTYPDLSSLFPLLHSWPVLASTTTRSRFS